MKKREMNSEPRDTGAEEVKDWGLRETGAERKSSEDEVT